MPLVFATNNEHKLKEVRKILPESLKIMSLKDIDCYDDLPETGQTIRSNASQKSRYVHDKYGVDCFADDTGLEVLALNGRPGVYSARFAGPEADSIMNVGKLLVELKGVTDRRAAFRTAVSLFIDGKEFLFEGHIDGTISEIPSGTGGFGYDPVFIPEGSEITFSEMSPEQKNTMSHRAIAIRKLVSFLTETNYQK